MGEVPTEEAWLEMFERFSNWGRWGDQDEVGALNLISPEKVAAAATLVTFGRCVSCARRIDFAERASSAEASSPPLHFMTWTGSAAPATGGSGALDWVGLPLHGLYMTHLDAPSHAFWNGKMYNGTPATEVTAEFGARSGSIELAKQGIITRGVLVDVPRSLGIEALEAGHAIDAEELAAVAASQRVVVEPGDVVLVRTGYGRTRRMGTSIIAKDADPASAPHTPGLGVGALPWFYEHDVSVVGTDSATEARPSPYSFNAPVHAVLMCAMGAWVIDNLELEALGMVCEELGRWEFCITIAPLVLRRATGSPVNPIAMF